MLTSRQHQVLVEVAAICTPLVLVYFGRAVLSGAAPAATAVQVNSPVLGPPPAIQAKPLTAEQQKAAQWVQMIPETISLISPLNHPVETTVVRKDPVVEPQHVTPPPPPRDSPIRGLKLTAVLGNADDQLASINGKIFRIGDAVRPGLFLTTIDARNSRITLKNAADETFELKREQKQ